MFHPVRNGLSEKVEREKALPYCPSAGFRFLDFKPRLAGFREAVTAGLSAYPKTLEPKFFYDEAGSRLFEQICALPEYYPTRTEMAILDRYADAMSAAVGSEIELIEFGSGSSRKVRLLLDRLQPASYVAIDISREQLLDACSELAELYPALAITAVCADYSQPLHWAGEEDEEEACSNRLAFFPGSTIGNFHPHDAIAFLANVSRMVGKDGGLLIGVDLQKSRERLHAAYNDGAGITAAFNLNLLHRINRELDGNFIPDQFFHQAFYDEAMARIEMHLVSRCAQQVRIGSQVFSFAEGESLHTENSYKYTVAGFQALAAQAGFHAREVWLDDAQLFSMHYLQAV